jgi:hypothetical protein
MSDIKIAKFSEYDTRGYLYVDCTECTRGRNGQDKDNCSAGYKLKKGHQGGCFLGTLLPTLKMEEENHVA